jgi:hypothetical protein
MTYAMQEKDNEASEDFKKGDKKCKLQLVVTLRGYVKTSLHSPTHSCFNTSFHMLYYLATQYSDKTPHISIIGINKMR